MDDKEKKSISQLIIGGEWTALIVVGLAVCLLLMLIFKLITKDSEKPASKPLEIKYQITISNNTNKNAKDSISIVSIEENNKKLLEEINSSVKSQHERMESILSVQEDRSNLFTYGAGFLSILVALATFFGFKSINEMKKSTVETAEIEAKKVAEVEAKAEVQQNLEEIKKDIRNQINFEFKEKFENKELQVSDDFTNKLNESIDAKIFSLQEQIEKCCEKRTTESNSENSQVEEKKAGEYLETETTKEKMGDLFSDEYLSI